jgi:hypothetical protein
MLSMLLFALARPHPMLDDGIRVPPPSRSLDQASMTNGQRIARGLPPAKPKRAYSKDRGELSLRVAGMMGWH